MTLDEWKKKHDTGAKVSGVKARDGGSSSQNGKNKTSDFAQSAKSWQENNKDLVGMTPSINPVDTEKLTLHSTKTDGTPTIAGRLNNMTVGAIEGTTSGMMNAAGTAVAGLSKLNAGQNKTVAKLGGNLEKAADSVSEDSAQQITAAKQGAGKVGKFLIDTGVAGMQMVGDAGAAALTGGSSLIPMFIRSFGGGAQEARQAGKGLGTQLLYGAGEGAIQVGTEKMFNVGSALSKIYGKGVADDVVKGFINKATKSATGRAFLEAGASAAGEGFEEFVGDFLEPYLKRATGVDSSARFDLGQAAYDAAVGAALGGVGAAGNVVQGIQAQKSQNSSKAVDSVYEAMKNSGVFSQEARNAGKAAHGKFVKANDMTGATVNDLLLGRKPEQIQNAETYVQTQTAQNTANSGINMPVNETAPTTQKNANTGELNAQNEQQNSETMGDTSFLDAQTDSLSPEAVKRQAAEAMLSGGKRVDQETLSNEQFDAAAEAGAAIDADGKVYMPEAEDHIDNRSPESVTSQNAFQFDHPEVHSYMQEAAKDLIDDLSMSLQSGQYQTVARDLNGNKTKKYSNMIRETPSIRAAMDITGETRSEIIDAAQRLIDDHGQENVAAAKRLELVLDDMLTNGYTTTDGSTVAPNEAYIQAKGEIVGAGEVQEAGHGLDGIDELEPGQNSVGAAKQGFTTRGMEGTEQTSKLADSNPYNKTQEAATAMKKANYEQLFKYTSMTEAESMHAAEELLYTLDSSGNKTFIGDTDPESLADIQRELTEAPAWNGVMTDAARMIQTELQGRSANMEIPSEDYVKWIQTMREHSTETGRGVQANAKWSRNDKGASTEADAWDNLQKSNLSDEERNETFQRIVKHDMDIEKVADGDTNALKDIILQVAGERGTINNFLTKKQGKVMTSLASSALDSLTFDELKSFAHASTSALSTDATPTDIGRKIKAIQVLNMLSKPTTPAKNITGNTSFYGIDAASMRGASILDMALSKITGTRSVAFEKPTLFNAESKKAFLRSLAEVTLDVDMDGSTSRYGTSSSRTFKASGNLFDRFVSAMERNQAYLLNSTDEFYKGAARSTAEGTQSLIDSGKIKTDNADYATQQADNLAKYRTFQDNSRIADAIQELHDLLNTFGFGDSGRTTARGNTIKAFGLGDLAAPFTKVAGNLVSRGADYSVFNAAKGAYEIASVISDKVRGKTVDPAKQAKAVSDTTRGLNGTAIAVGFAALAANGLMQRADDEDDENVASLNATEGMNGTQLNLTATQRALDGGSTEWKNGDTLIDLSSIEPLNVLMNLGTKLAEDYGNGGIVSTVKGIPQSSLSSFYEASSELPLVQNIGDFAKEVGTYHKDPTEVLLEQGTDTVASSMIPNILAGIAKSGDDTVRNTYSSGTLVGNTIDGVKSKIPGWREELPASLDGFGREKKYSGDEVSRYLNNLFNPTGVNTYNQSKVSEEMEKVRNATGETSFYPDKSAPSKVSVGGDDISLTFAQKQAYQKARGSTSLNLMVKVMGSSSYKKSTAREKAAMLDKVEEYANDQARTKVLKAESGMQPYTDAMKAGIDFGSFYNYKLATNDMQADKDASGKSIANSKKKKVVSYINGLDLTKEQKDYLYYDVEGYKDSKSGGYAPWH